VAAASVKRALLSAVVALPVALVLGAFESPLFFFAALLPVAVASAPEVRLRDLVAQRREGVERELPFFAVLVSVLGSAGVPLYSIFKDLGGGEIFGRIGREALLVRRDVEILGLNPNEAFERIASSHPSKRFSEFLLGYTSKVRSGGDVPLYLVGESGSLLRDLEDGWGRYAARVGIVGSMMITVFGVVPLLLMVVGVFSPGISIVGLVAFTGLGVPAFTVALLYMTGRMQPTKGEAVEGRAGTAVALALPGAVLGLLTRLAWVGVAGALFIFFTAYGLSVRGRLAETKGVDEGTSRFLKDLLEYRRQEYDLAKSVVSIEASGGYNKHFDRVLSRVASQLRAGVPLDEVKVECRGALGRLAFVLLGKMARSGGGTVDTVYQVSSFADRLIGMRRSAGAEMKPYLFLSYISPLLLAFGVTFVEGVLSTFSSRVSPGFSALRLSGVQLGSVPAGLSQVSDLLIVVSAASLGLIGAKITDLTVRNTLKASANVMLAVAGVSVMALVSSHSLSQLL
jgi:flagellar protein FlaJ